MSRRSVHMLQRAGGFIGRLSDRNRHGSSSPFRRSATVGGALAMLPEPRPQFSLSMERVGMYDFSWHGSHGDLTSSSAKAVVPILCSLFDIESVLDVGCGDGP